MTHGGSPRDDRCARGFVWALVKVWTSGGRPPLTSLPTMGDPPSLADRSHEAAGYVDAGERRVVMKAARTLSVVAVLVVGVGVVAEQARAETREAAAARADIQKTFGFVPGFLKATPDVALPGAWMDMKALQLNPATALSGKTKELVGLAVSAQIPCRYCIYAHTQFAKLNGATQAEIGEALTIGALTRKWSTVINGLPQDEAKFK